MSSKAALLGSSTLTSQQAALVEWAATGTGNAIGLARAGAGKTSTALACIAVMTGSVAVTSFNKEITAEIAGKIVARGLNAEAKTAHGFGFRAWRNVHSKVRLDEKKIVSIMDEMAVPSHLRGFVAKAVSMAKQRAIGILTTFVDQDAWMGIVAHYRLDAMLTQDLLREAGDERPLDQIVRDGLNMACRVLKQSIRIADQVIDYDDQIYMPIYAGARIRQYDNLIVDEAQDTNPVRRLLYKAMLRPGGRLLAIGDDKQAINGFAGADNDSLDIIRREFDCAVYPMTYTFRCPVAVVREAQQYVPDIESAPGAAEGRVLRIEESEFAGMALVPGEDAIICRNTAPLVTLFYKLLKAGIPAKIEGRKDEMGPLLRLAFRWKRVDSLGALVDRLTAFRDDQTAMLVAAGKVGQAEALADRVDTLLAIIEGMAPDASLDDLKPRVESMFVDTKTGERLPVVALMTAHRSKGREFRRVFIWGANIFMPSRRAETAEQVAQEDNLIYVAITRALETLVWVRVQPKASKGSRHSAILPVSFVEGMPLSAEDGLPLAA